MNDAYYEPISNDTEEKERFMQSQRERAINTIAKELNMNIIDEIAICIAYSYKDGLDDAINLVNRLFLSQSDMFAILDDYDNFWDAIAKEGLDD